jgi:hypothetical protein
VGLFPGDDRVADDADTVDLGLDNITRAVVQGSRIIADGGYNTIGA